MFLMVICVSKYYSKLDDVDDDALVKLHYFFWVKVWIWDKKNIKFFVVVIVVECAGHKTVTIKYII